MYSLEVYSFLIFSASQTDFSKETNGKNVRFFFTNSAKYFLNKFQAMLSG